MSSQIIENRSSERSVGSFEDQNVEEATIPPEYQLADRHFKKYCNCKDEVSCNFCKWFYRVKNCPTHGDATKRTLKTCFCSNEEEIGENEKEDKEMEEKSHSSNSRSKLSGLKFESRTLACQCIQKKRKSHVSNTLGEEFIDHENEDKLSGASCRCSDPSDSVSDSSSGVDTNSSIGSLNLSSDSYEDINIGEGLDGIGGSSNTCSSEDSSVEGCDLDMNRAKWGITSKFQAEVSMEPKEVDLLAAQWGIKNIYGKNSSSKTHYQPYEPKQDEYCYHKYRLVQKCSRKNYFLKACKTATNKM